MSDTPKNKGKTLIFVYNADSGILNTIVDYAHKMVSPKDLFFLKISRDQNIVNKRHYIVTRVTKLRESP